MYIYVSVKLPLAHTFYSFCYHGLRRMLKVLLTTVNFYFSIFFFLLLTSFTFLLFLIQTWSPRLHRGALTAKFNILVSGIRKALKFWRAKKNPSSIFLNGFMFSTVWFTSEVQRSSHRNCTTFCLLGRCLRACCSTPFLSISKALNLQFSVNLSLFLPKEIKALTSVSYNSW